MNQQLSTHYHYIVSPKSLSQTDTQSSQYEKYQSISLLDHSNIILRETSINLMLKLYNKYKIKHDTLFLAINILDFLILARQTQSFNDPQLLGGVLILLTSKYNQVYPVTIDQVNLNITKYYPRESFYHIQGHILQAINFELPNSTIYSQLYNQLEPTKLNYIKFSSDKENNSCQENIDTESSEKNQQLNLKDVAVKTLEIIKQPKCLKYGQKLLYQTLLSYFIKQNSKNESVKKRYIRNLIREIIQPQRIEKKSKKINDSMLKTPQLKGKKSIKEKKIVFKTIPCSA